MGTNTQTAKKRLEGVLRELATHREAFIERAEPIEFDKLWWLVKDRSRLVGALTDYVREICPEVDQGGILLLAPDLMVRNLGTLPIVAAVADEIGAPFGVWKELGNVVEGKAILFGPTDVHFKCLVIQDAVIGGSTVAKMATDLLQSEWEIKVYIALFAIMPDVGSFRKELTELLLELELPPVRFEYVVHWPARTVGGSI